MGYRKPIFIGMLIVIVIAAIDVIGCWQQKANDTFNSIDNASTLNQNYEIQELEGIIIEEPQNIIGFDDIGTVRVIYCDELDYCDNLGALINMEIPWKIGEVVDVKVGQYYDIDNFEYIPLRIAYKKK